MIVPKNIDDALLPITISSWIMGIDVIEFPLGKHQTILSIIYSNVCIVINCASLCIHYFTYSLIYGSERKLYDLFLFMFLTGNIFLCTTGIILSKTNAQVSTQYNIKQISFT